MTTSDSKLLSWIKNNHKMTIGGLVFLSALFLCGFRQSLAPSFLGDEYTYFSIARNLLVGNGLVTYSGSIWLRQPPLYFFVLAPFLKLENITSISISSILQARTLSALFFGLDSLMLYALGLRLKDLKFATTIAFLFLLTPFVLGQSRMGLIDTFSLFLSISCLYLFFTRRYLSSGFVLGLTFLTKEVAGVPTLVVILLYFLMTKYFSSSFKILFKNIQQIIIPAFCMYAFYLGWALYYYPFQFIEAKIAAINQFLGNAPGADLAFVGSQWNFWGRVADKLSQDLITFVIVGLSVPLIMFIGYEVITRRNDSKVSSISKNVQSSSIFILSYFTGNYLFFFLLQDRNSPYWIPPIIASIFAVGYFAEMRLHSYALAIAKFAASRPKVFKNLNRRKDTGKIFSIGLSILIIFAFCYNSVIWVKYYGIGSDTAFQDVINYVNTSIPKNSSIWGNSFLVNFIESGYVIYPHSSYNSLNSIRGDQIKYLIFSPYWATLIDANLTSYITSNGVILFSSPSQANKFIAVYYVKNPI